MKIDAVTRNGFINRTSVLAPKRQSYNPVSFCGLGDIYSKSESSIDELINSINESIIEIRSLVSGHKKDTKELIERAISIQGADEATPEAVKNFAPFKAFFNLLEEPQMQKLKKVFEDINTDSPFIYFQNKWSDNSTSSCVMFQSQDKALAVDASKLYDFFVKAQFNQKNCSQNFEEFYQMYTKAFMYDYAYLSTPITKDFDVASYQDALTSIEDGLCGAARRNFDATGRPTIIFVDDFEKLIDHSTNAKENIACMKEFMNTTASDDKCLIFFGIQSPYKKTIDPGTLQPHRVFKTVDLDKLGITRADIEALKNMQKQLTPQLDELSELYKGITPEIMDRMRDMHMAFCNLVRVYEDMKSKFPQDFETYGAGIKKLFDKLLALDLPEEISTAAKDTTSTVIESKLPKAATNITSQMQSTVKEVSFGQIPSTIKNLPCGKIIAAGALILCSAGAAAYKIISTFKNRDSQSTEL